MTDKSTLKPIVILTTAAMLLAMVVLIWRPAHPVQAANYNLSTCSTTDLITAITAANGSSQNDTITLLAGCTYTITAIADNRNGLNGLPSMANNGSLTLNGSGATLVRSTTLTSARIFHVENGATVTINNLMVRDGLLANNGQYGGLLYNAGGNVTLQNSHLTGGQVTFVGGRGGAIYNAGGTLTINASTLSANQTTYGGGIFNFAGTINLINSTLSGNIATSQGGGIYNLSSGGTTARITLQNVTLTANQANTDGAGIFNNALDDSTDFAVVSFNHTIIGNNLGSGRDCDNRADSVAEQFNANGDYNLDSDGSCFALTPGNSNTGTHNRTSSVLNLGNLQLNPPLVYSVPTHAPLAGSSAIDTGACVETVDQRQQPRPNASSSFCDIGAHEADHLGGRVDMEISKTVQPSRPVYAGETISYTLSFLNNSFAGATGVRITDIVPITLTGVTISHSGPSITNSGSPPAYLWQVADLPAGEGGLITITGQVSPTLSSSSSFDNQAFIGSTAYETAPSDNSSAIVPVVVNLPRLSIADVSVSEAVGSMVVTVTLDITSRVPIQVEYTTTPNSATAGVDYTTVNSTLIIPANNLHQTFTIPLVNDSLYEVAETITLTLSNPVNATLNTATAIGTILNDDASPYITTDDPTVLESSGRLTFTVSLSEASSLPVTVNYISSDNSALASQDYIATSGTLVIPAGATSGAIGLPILEDNLYEGTETFSLTLSGPLNGQLIDPVGRGTITDNEARPTLIITDVAQSETVSPLVVTVTLSAISGLPATFTYSTTDISATGGNDYGGISTSLTIPAGTRSRTFNLTLFDDSIYEEAEQFRIGLSNPSNLNLVDSEAIVTLIDDDPLPQVTLTTNPHPEALSPMPITVTLNRLSNFAVTMDYSSTNHTAVAGADYTGLVGNLIIPAGLTETVINVPIINDTLDELNETFTMTLSNVVSGTVALSQLSATILDDDAPPNISVTPTVSALESAGRLTFTVALSAASSFPVTVTYATIDNSASNLSDYQANNGLLRFNPGETSHEIAVVITPDLTFEADETFTLTLSGAINGNILVGTGIGQIINDDAPPQVTVDDVSQSESGGLLTFTIELNTASLLPVQLTYETINASATGGNDFTPIAPTSLTIPAGDLSRTVTVTVTPDTIYELTETFVISLANLVNATYADGQGSGTIIDDDLPPTIDLGNATNAETNANLAFPITLSQASAFSVIITYTTQNSSAIAPADFIAATGATLLIPAGITQTTIPIGLNDDTIYETNETFTITINAVLSATLGNNQAIGTIIDDETLPQITISSATANEADGSITFNLALSSISAFTTTVQFSTVPNTALAGASNDYLTHSGLITFAPGIINQSITVNLVNDTIYETTETFSLTLASPMNATLAVTTVTATINDDDSPPALTINDVTQAENLGPMLFTVTLSGASQVTTTVDFSLSNGTATANDDFITQTGRLTFSPGIVELPITVVITNDTHYEATETFTIRLSNPLNGTLADDIGLGTINNDDAQPNIIITDSSADEANGLLTFTVSLTAVSGLDVTVQYSSTNGTATAGTDYGAVNGNLTIPTGLLSRLITISVIDDLFYEGNETFTLTLSSPLNGTIADNVGIGTIIDNDPIPSLSVADAFGTETNGLLTFTVSLDALSSQAINFNYRTLDSGSATNNLDFTEVPTGVGVGTIPTGALTTTVTIIILDDLLTGEGLETFTLDIYQVSPAGYVTNPTGDSATGTIMDDDIAAGVIVSDATAMEEVGWIGFTVTLTSVVGSDVVITYTTQAGTATPGSDYIDVPIASLTIPAGSLNGFINVNIINDATQELTETFTISITDITNGHVVVGVATGTIIDKDPMPIIEIVPSVWASEAVGVMSFTVTISNPTVFTVTADYNTVDLSALSSSDYVTQSGILTITPGNLTTTIRVPITDDLLVELTEDYRVEIKNPINAVIPTFSGIDQSRGYISNNDIPEFEIGDAFALERNGVISLPISMTLNSSFDIAITYTTAASSATAGTDYITSSGFVLMPAGSTTVWLPITILDDLVDEPSEWFTVDLVLVSRGTISDNIGLATIIDDDNPPDISIHSASTREDSSPLIFTAWLTAPSSFPITVTYITTDNTAISPTDYSGVPATELLFVPGQQTQTLSFSVVDDNLYESNETFTLTLSNLMNGGLILTDTVIGTIIDDENLPGIIITPVTVAEDVGLMVVTVGLTATSSFDVGVDYATSDNSALAATDYRATTGRITITAGTLQNSFTIPITDDAWLEYREQFRITLSNPLSGTLSQATADGRIIDNDPFPNITLAGQTANETESALIFTVTLTQVTEVDVGLDYATSNGSAQAGADYLFTTGRITLTAGTLSRTISVALLDDLINELPETFNLLLSNPISGTISDTIAIGTIIDNEDLPRVTMTAGSANEADGQLNFTVSLTIASSAMITVHYSTQNGTAIEATDYITETGIITFTPGITTKLVPISLLDDTLPESVETFNLRLQNPQNSLLSDTVASGTIIDNDAPPGINLANVTANEGDGVITFTFTLTASAGFPVVITYTTADNTALASNDYLTQSGRITIPTGNLSYDLPIVLTDDGWHEATESFLLKLTGVISGVLIDNSAQGTIIDNDPLPNISLTDVTTNEGAGLITFTINLSAPSAFDVSLNYSSTNGSALAGQDYIADTNTVTIPAGNTEGTITFALIDDTMHEQAETFTVSLTSPVSGTLLTPTVVGTITDNDPTPTIQIADATANEGDGLVTFTVSLNTVSGVDVLVDYQTSNGSASAPDDYLASNSTLTIPAGSISGMIAVNVVDDSSDEPAETFGLTLSNPIHGTIIDNVGIATINDNDGPPALTIAPASASEGAGFITFTVMLSVSSSFSVSVDYHSTPNQANTPADFGMVNSTLTIPPGSLTGQIAVPLVDDGFDEAAETFTMTLSNPVSGTLGNPITVLGTINDNDAPPTIQVVTTNVAEDAGSVPFTLTLSAVSGREVALDYQTNNGSAIAPTDYLSTTNRITFTPGLTQQVVWVTIVDDTMDEPAETFSLTLSNLLHVNLGAVNGTATINDNDNPPMLSIQSSTVRESLSPMPITVTLSEASGYPVTVDYLLTNDTAVSPADYINSGLTTLTFSAGITQQFINVPIINDTLDESNEQFTVTLQNPVSVTLLTAQATGIIQDDDLPPTLSIAGTSELENKERLTFTLSLNTISSYTVTATYATSDKTATAGVDYIATSGRITIPAGQLTTTASITIVDDTLDEANETFTLTITGLTHAIAGISAAVGQINDDDITPSLTINDAQAVENLGPIQFVVQLSTISGLPVTVTYSSTSDIAVSGIDFNGVVGQIVIPAGDISGTLDITLINDTIEENSEDFFVDLSAPQNATLLDGQAIGTILNDDPAPTAWINDVTVTESAGTVEFEVWLSAIRGIDFSPAYSTTAQTAQGGVDYVGVNSGLTIPAGDISGTISIPLLDDAIYENDETFNIFLTVIDTVTLVDNMAIGTIQDDDPLPALEIVGNSATEAAGSITFTIRLTEASGVSTSFSYTSTNNTALSGADYIGVSNQLGTIPAGITETTISINLINDSSDEPNEHFTITVGSLVNATLLVGTAQGTIIDDDPVPTLTLNNPSADEADGVISFTLSLNSASAFPITVTYTTNDNSAVAGVDYVASGPNQLTIPAGTVTAQIGVTLLDNVVDDADRTFFMALSSPINVTLATLTGTGTILNDDTADFTVSPTSLNTSETGTVDSFRVRLNSEPTDIVTVTITSLDSSEGTVSPTVLTFTQATWQINQTIDVTGQADGVFDADVVYLVQLNAAASADPNYDGLNPADVTVQNNNIDLGNTAPTISTIADQIIMEDTPLNLTFTINDAETGPNALNLFATSTEQTVVANTNLTLSGTGNSRTLTLQPTLDMVGTATINITVSDGSLSASTSFMVTVQAVNDPPIVLQSIPNQTTLEDSLFTYTVLANTFADTDLGDVLTYSATLAGGNPLPAWLTFNPTTLTFSGTTTNDEVGTYQLTVMATDLMATSVVTNFEITVINVNDPPTVTMSLPNLTIDEDTPFAYTVSRNLFTDIDIDDVLTYSATLADGSVWPDWLSFNPTNLTFSGLPTQTHVGSYTLQLEAKDLAGATVETRFTLIVRNQNDAPFVTQPIPNQTANEDELYQYIIPVGTFTDPDPNDHLTYTVALSEGLPLPDWLTFDPATQTFSGTPTNADVGSIIIMVTAQDEALATATTHFTLTVINVNDPPLLRDDIAETETNMATVIQPLVNDTDPDGDIITLTTVSQSNQGTATIRDSIIIYTPPTDFVGLATFTYNVTDPSGAISQATITVVVGGSAQAVDDHLTLLEDNSASIAVLANDYTQDSPLILLAVSTPLSGTTVISGDTIIYSPSLNYYGLDWFEYIVTDGRAVDVGLVTVTVEPVNDAPLALDDQLDTYRGVPTIISVLNNDRDIEADPLFIQQVAQPQHGTAVISGSRLIYTPNPTFYGLETFTYTIVDGPASRSDSLTDTATVQVRVSKIAPPVANNDAITMSQSTPQLILAVLDNDYDPNDLPLTLADFSTPSHGTVRLNGNTLLYQPNPGFVGTDTFNYTISNGNLTSIAFVNITIIPLDSFNNPPLAYPDVVTTTINTPILIPALANDIDPENGLLTIISVGNPNQGQAFVNGSTILYTPNSDFVGRDHFIYHISDGQLTDTSRITITVEDLVNKPSPTDTMTITLITPIKHQIISTTRPIFAWANDGRAVSYTLLVTVFNEINVDSQTTQPFVQRSTTQPTISLDIDLPHGVYLWTIIAYDSQGNRIPSPSPEYFVVDDLCGDDGCHTLSTYLPLIRR